LHFFQRIRTVLLDSERIKKVKTVVPYWIGKHAPAIQSVRVERPQAGANTAVVAGVRRGDDRKLNELTPFFKCTSFHLKGLSREMDLAFDDMYG
jgi:hypothetical protein